MIRCTGVGVVADGDVDGDVDPQPAKRIAAMKE
jgi:hypothetical protein